MIKGLAVTVLAAGSVTIAAHPVPGPVASPAALVRVSGASPVAGCLAAAASLLPPGSTEPVIAVNPRNPPNWSHCGNKTTCTPSWPVSASTADAAGGQSTSRE